MTLAPGAELGPYQIDALLGVGGMGEVYRATDRALGRQIAIKVLPADLATDPDRLRRFEHEARVVAALNHPNIVTIYSVEHAGDVRFLTMELIEGRRLADLIPPHGLPLERLLEIAIPLADAVGAAHARGIIHRDLKPANVMVTDDGRVKVLDFGVAKLRPAIADGEMTTEAHAPTTTHGMVVGTVAYMSPEQAEGREVDARSDLFSLGVVLFEMATGQRPFQGESSLSVLSALLKDTPPAVTDLRPELPRDVARLIRRCLAKDPGRRYQSAIDLRNDLEELADDLGRSASRTVPTRIRTRRREPLFWAITALAIGTISLAGGIWANGRRSAPPAPTAFNIMPPEGLRFPFLLGVSAISPDGSQIAFVADRRLWIQPLDQTEPHEVMGPEGPSSLFWSPDSRSLAYFEGFNSPAPLRRINLSAPNSPVIRLTEDGSAFGGGDWGPSGILYVGSDGRLFHMVASGDARPTPVTALDASRLETEHAYPEFLPDGRRFLFLARSENSSMSAVFLGSLDSPVRTLVLDVPSRAKYANGYLLYQKEGQLTAVPFDAAKARPTGESVVLDTDVLFHRTQGNLEMSTSETGMLTYRRYPRREETRSLQLVDGSGSPIQAIGPPGLYRRPRLSSDGRHLIVAITGASNQNGDIFVFDDLQREPRQLTSDPHDDENPIWSPTAECVVFNSNRTGQYQMYAKAVGGAAPESRLLDIRGALFPEDISPDGVLVFRRELAAVAPSELWAMAVTADCRKGGEPYRLFPDSRDEQSDARFSQDGRWLAYREVEGSTTKTFIQRFPPNPLGKKLPLGAQNPVWIDGGGRTQLIFRSGDDITAAELLVDRNGEPSIGPARKLFGFQRVAGLEANRSGGRFLLVTTVPNLLPTPITVWQEWPSLLIRR